MDKDRELLEAILDELDKSFTDASMPPPNFDAVAEAAAATPSGVDDAEMDRNKRQLQERLLRSATIGTLLARRRALLGRDQEDVAMAAGWTADDVESLEADHVDLHHVSASKLGTLLFALDIVNLSGLKLPLRELAKKHLAVYQSGAGQVFGRTRKGVTSYERRDGLQRGVADIDVEATARAADIYVRQVEQRLQELAISRSS